MDHLIPFMKNHWLLWTAFFIILLLIIAEELRVRWRGIAKVTPTDLIQLMNREQAIIWDIRGQDAYNSGHILGAISMTPNALPEAKAQSDKVLVLVCMNGQDSLTTATKLKAQGLAVKVLAGGINAWKMADLPLTKR